MLITIAIPAFNEEKLLPSTLSAVAKAGEAFAERGWEMEVVVCDNNSTDHTGEIARVAGARVVFEEHNQISRARNVAGKAAKGEWIIFVDGDSKPNKVLFEATAEAMEKNGIVGGGTTVKFEGGKKVPVAVLAAERIWNGISRVMCWPAGSYIFCRTYDFHELNGFSEQLYASEEIEFGRRLKKLGKKRQQRFQIFTQTPISTSDRKAYSVSYSEILRVLFLSVITVGRSCRKVENCNLWYDSQHR